MSSSSFTDSSNRPGTIVLRDVSKRYRLGEMQLHRSVTRWIRGGEATEEFWALQKATVTISPGEAVGIVGPNAAGKSTLLKIIAGITSPTSGTVETRGHIGSLIELGAGFHPELTGRENLALLGTLLGFSRSEMRARMDDIIAFADIGPFLATPLKRYSSGMQVRLGFAVAVSSEPEILLIDEALAVGDTEFQEKCLQRINELRSRGVTIIFVSHVLGFIEQICERVLWMENGGVRLDGEPRVVLPAYQHACRQEKVSADRD